MNAILLMAKSDNSELTAKICQLVRERGWNMEEFARIARISRHTVRQMFKESGRRLHNATVGACARALGISVDELRTLPLERLLPRMKEGHPSHSGEMLRNLYDQAWQPELIAWLERNPERARQLSPTEVEEILAVQGPDGPLGAYGVDGYITRLERRRELVRQVIAVAGTEFLGLLEQFVGVLYDKTQPAR